MTKRIFSNPSFTPTAQADGVLTGSWAAMKPGTSTDIMRVNKIFCLGQAAAAGVNAMQFARSSTLGITPTTLALPNTDGPLNTNATAITNVPVCYVAASTAPNRSPAYTVTRLNLSFNPFGGQALWQSTPGYDDDWMSFGNATTSQSESVLSAANVGTAGLMGSDIFYEIL